MAGEIGKSTDPSTVSTHADVPVTSDPASFRYFNPGAQYPNTRAAAFGQLGYGVLHSHDGEHKIAHFPHPVNGAASNFDLLSRNYVGMEMGAAGKKWTGSFGFGIPGFPDSTVLTKEMLLDPKLAIPIMKAIAGRECGRGPTRTQLTDQEWQQAHDMFRAGSADAFLGAPAKDGQPGGNDMPHGQPGGAAQGPTGAGLLRRAREHVKERYVLGTLVPKDEANWKGPWDCAEFMSWLVFQEAGLIYGCVDDKVKPSQADAYTGAWRDDVERLGKRVSVEEAASTIGGILLRYPPSSHATGHIVLSDGAGGTVEAMDTAHGLVESTVHGRRWDTGVLIPGISYDGHGGVEPRPPARIYRPDEPNMDQAVIRRIQEALSAKGFLDQKNIDGEFDAPTENAVIAFQRSASLVADGEVGDKTAAALGISLKPAEPPAKTNGDGTRPGAEKAGPPKDGKQDKPDAPSEQKTSETGKVTPPSERQTDQPKDDRIAALEKQLAALQSQADVDNTKDARATMRALAGGDGWIARAPAIVSYIVIAGFFVVLGVLIFHGATLSDDNTSVLQLVNIVLGALTAAFATVINFWLGSSQGSRVKDYANATTTAAALEAQAAQHSAALQQSAKQTETLQSALNKAIESKPSAAPAAPVAGTGAGRFKASMDFVLDQRHDPSFGITLDEFKKWRNDDKLTAAELQNLSRPDACEYYRTRFWNVLRCDDLPAGVDLAVLAYAVELGPDAGPAIAAKSLQKVVGAADDGSVGTATVAAAKAMSPRDIVRGISKSRIESYSAQPPQGISVADWASRTTAVEQAALKMIEGGAAS
jgi:peptidoglycan hydrolase-like protein with peptidoglycan-binding domain